MSYTTKELLEVIEKNHKHIRIDDSTDRLVNFRFTASDGTSRYGFFNLKWTRREIDSQLNQINNAI